MKTDYYVYYVSDSYASLVEYGDETGLDEKEAETACNWLENESSNITGFMHWTIATDETSDNFRRCEISGLLSNCVELRAVFKVED